MSCKKVVIDAKRVEELAAQGLSKEEIILCLDVGASTFYRNQAESGELGVAYERGRARGVKDATDLLLNYHVKKKKSFEALRFYLKSRSDLMKEKTEVKLSGDQDSPVEVKTTHINSLNIPALAAEVEELMSIARQRKAKSEAHPEGYDPEE